MSYRKMALLVGAVMALVMALACVPQQRPGEGGTTGTPPDGQDEIVIGATLPLTGAESRIGGYYKQGYELAFEQANSNDGLEVGGQRVPVTLKLLDDTTTQVTATNLAERLINQDGVDALLGTYSTALVEAQSTVAEQNRIPYVNGGGAATSIYQRGYRWIFGVLAPVELLATSQMDWITAQQRAGKISNPARIALLWENTSHGEDFRKGVRDWVESGQGAFEIVVDESFELDSRDFSALLGQVRAADADLFLVDAHLPDFITMQRQYVTSGMCHEVITYGARGTEAGALEALGRDNVDYILSGVWWNAQLGNEGLNREFLEAYEAKYGSEPEWYAALAFQTALALFQAIEEAGGVDREALREALATLRMPSMLPGGELTFPVQTGYQARYPLVVQQNQPGGGSPIIYPADVATAEGVAPNPNCAR